MDENTIDETAKKVLDAFKASKEYVSGSYWKTWDDCWKVYNGERVNRNYNGTADIVDNLVYSNVQTMLANLVSSKPRFSYMPTKPSQTKDTETLNKLIAYYWEASDMDIKLVPFLKDMLLYGTGVLFTYWEMDRPEVYNQPLKDFYFDPTATDIDCAKYVVRRFLTTKEELKEYEAVDPKTGEMTPIYKNLDKIEGPGDDEESDKATKDMFMGSTLGKDARKDQIEVLEYWSEDKVIAVANRKTVIRNEDNPYKEIPFVVQRNDIDGSLFLGKGDVEPVIGQQEYLNDLINQSLDNTTYVLNNMWTLDPAFADMANEIESIPGAAYSLPDGALKPIDKPIMTNHALNERQEIKSAIREASGIDEVVKGVGQDRGNADITATEINQQVQSASKKIALKISMLENEGYKRLGELWFNMIQKFLKTETMVRITDDEGINWASFDPKDYEGEYEPKVELETTLRAFQKEESDKWQAVYSSMLGNPNINQLELDKLFLQKSFQLAPDEVDKLIAPMPGTDPTSAMVDPKMTQQSGPMDSITKSLSFKDLPEDAKAQILSEMGIQSEMPSPIQQNIDLQTHNVADRVLGGANGQGQPQTVSQ